MQTRLSLFCDGFIEAGLAATVVAVPLFFSVYGRMAFDLSKIALFRSLILAMAVAWLVRTAEAGLRPGTEDKAGTQPSGLVRLLHAPLALPISILAVSYVLSTVLSIWPRGSLWGSYLRSQGTYASLAYMALFPLALATLRRQEQVDRLVTTILLTSLPVTLYGIMQHYHLDPFRWTGLSDAVAERAISTMGNPLFMAAYLLMVVPLTLSRLLSSLTSLRQGRVATSTGLFLAACYGLLLAAQLLAFLFTQSRGALVGLGVGCLLLALLLATLQRRRAQILTFTLLGIQVLLFFVILNLPNTPLEPLRRLPYLDRLGSVFDFQSGSGRLRLLIWGATLDLAQSDPLRAAVGYGPETLGAAVGPYMSTSLVRIGFGYEGTIPDRAHNETMDALATTGLMGTAAYLLVIFGLLFYGLKALGLAQGTRQRNALVILCLTGAAILPLIFRALEGTWRLVGLAVPIGMVSGLFVYVLGYSFLGGHESPTVGMDRRTILLSALLAAAVAHFVEVQFGIVVPVTRALLWLYAALIIAVGVRGLDESGEPPAESPETAMTSPRRRRRRRRTDLTESDEQPSSPPSPAGSGRIAFVYFALVMGLALLTLGFDFSAPSAGITLNMLLFFVGVSITGGIIIHAETESLGGQEVGGDWSPLVYLGVSVVPLLLFAAGLIPLATTLAKGLGALVVYHLWLFMILVVLAGWLSLTSGSVPIALARRRPWPYLAVLAAALMVIVITNVTPLRADMIYARALASPYPDDRIAFLRQAIDIAPNEAQLSSLGGAYLAKARASATASEAYVSLESAREAFERAWQLEPVLPDRTANLGDLYREWGELSLRSEDRLERFSTAIGYYVRAGEMSRLETALSSEELSETYLLLGETYAVMGQPEQASDAYNRAVETAPDSAWAHLARGALRAQAGELEAAVEAIQRATDLAPESYVAHWSLARIHNQLLGAASASDEADKARALAPESLRPHLETVLGTLDGGA